MRQAERYRIVLLAAALAAVAAACGPAGSERPAVDGPLYLPGERARAGEAVFRRELCGRCHTLFERPPATGPFELPVPFQPRRFGSRVGPDLALLGHSRSDDWQLAHLYAPGVLVPASRMPPARRLFELAPGGTVPQPTAEAIDLVAFLQALGRSQRDIWAERRCREPDIPPPPPSARQRLLARGQTLYRQHCVPCHGADGDGHGEAAPLLRFPPRDFVAARYRFRSTPVGSPPLDADLFRSITLGTGNGAAMPSFRHLAAEDRWALVLRVKEFAPHLRGQKLEATPAGEGGSPAAPSLSAQAAEAGRRWWLDLGCPRCHGDDGAGIERRAGGFDWTDRNGVPVPESGDLRHACGLRGGASPAALERAVLNGVGDAMPAYAGLLASPEMAELVAYLLSLQRPLEAERNAGGGEAAARPSTEPDTRNRR